MDLLKKLKYLFSSTTRIFTEDTCPFCGSSIVKVDSRKYMVTSLIECKNCSLKFRFPKDSINHNLRFYNSSYIQPDGITTFLPNDNELKVLINNNFNQKNASEYIELIKILFPNKRNEEIRVLDFGSNWGYTSYQFKSFGFEVSSYEISITRAKFGNDKLDLDIQTDINNIKEPCNIFFSSHVIEHLPDINIMFSLARKILKKGDYFIAFCPNGSREYKNSDPKGYQSSWGLVHPNYISANFIEKQFSSNDYLIGSRSKYMPLEMDLIHQWSESGGKQISNLSYWELFFIIKF